MNNHRRSVLVFVPADIAVVSSQGFEEIAFLVTDSFWLGDNCVEDLHWRSGRTLNDTNQTKRPCALRTQTSLPFSDLLISLVGVLSAAFAAFLLPAPTAPLFGTRTL